MINQFRNEYDWLSNFWPCHVKYNNVRFPSVEHAYQAAKADTRYFNEFAKTIKTVTASKAKTMGKSVVLRKDWEKIKLNVMEDLLRQKFLQPGLKELLMLTKDEMIIEGNDWGDTFWGQCNGKGQNHLGRLIMKIREELK